MIKFIKETLSENGSPSSKRVAFFILLLAFLAQFPVSFIWGKIADPTLRDQLYYAMLMALCTIFGVNMYEKYRDIKMSQNNNSASTDTTNK